MRICFFFKNSRSFFIWIKKIWFEKTKFSKFILKSRLIKTVLCSINSFRETSFRSNNFLLSQWLKPANWLTPQGLLSLWFLTLGLSTQQSCWAYDFWSARCELNNIVESMVSRKKVLEKFLKFISQERFIRILIWSTYNIHNLSLFRFISQIYKIFIIKIGFLQKS